MCITRHRGLELRFAPTRVLKRIEKAVYHAQDTVAELRVVCAGSRTNKPLLGSADDWSRCGKIDLRKSGK
jgi:hypothetical protein